MEKIENFEYLFLLDNNFNPKFGGRLRNDIILIKFKNNSEMCRIFLNNTEEYVDLPYNKGMLNYIAHSTWTKDTTRENGKFIKSDKGEISLKSVLKRYDEKYTYSVCNSIDNNIPNETKEIKRKEFIKNNPYSNTINAWR